MAKGGVVRHPVAPPANACSTRPVSPSRTSAPPSGRTDASCRARGRVRETARADLTRDLGQDLVRHAAPGDLLGDRPVQVVVDTVMSMLDTG